MQLNLLGDLEIRTAHVEYEEEMSPALVLYRRGYFGRSAIIPLACAFKYDEPDRQPDEIMTMAIVELSNIAISLGYHVDGKLTAQLLMRIQDRLDDLVKMPPYVPEKKPKVLGIAEGKLNGKSFTREMTH